MAQMIMDLGGNVAALSSALPGAVQPQASGDRCRLSFPEAL